MLDHLVATVISATLDHRVRYLVPQHILQIEDDLDGMMGRNDGNQIKHGSAVRLKFLDGIGNPLKFFLLTSPPIPNGLLDPLLWVQWTRLLFQWKTHTRSSVLDYRTLRVRMSNILFGSRERRGAQCHLVLRIRRNPLIPLEPRCGVRTVENPPHLRGCSPLYKVWPGPPYAPASSRTRSPTNAFASPKSIRVLFR